MSINYVLENYFGRNDIRSFEYFKDPVLEPLQIIWEKYHHSITYIDRCRNTEEKIKQSQLMSGNLPTEKSHMLGGFLGHTTGSYNTMMINQEVFEKDREI